MKIRDMVSRVTAQMKNEKLKMKNKELKSKKLEAGIERSSFCVCFASHFSLIIIHFSLPKRSVIWRVDQLLNQQVKLEENVKL